MLQRGILVPPPMRTLAVILIVVCTFGRTLPAQPANRPSAQAFADARAQALATVRPSGPIIGPAVAHNPVPAPIQRFGYEYNRYIYLPGNGPYGWWGGGYFGGCRPWWGWGGGWWGGWFGVGASYQNSSGGVGW